MSSLVEPLRVCHRCGLVAYTKEDLESFVTHKDRPHGRTTLCKLCFNKHQKNRKDTDDRVYLKHKYNDMMGRCHNPKHMRYPYYGDRGIAVCDEWRDSSEAFVDWALSSGWKRGLEIDRINGDGPYSPNNCRWSTHIEQMHNRRDQTTFLEKGTRICCRCKIEKLLTAFHIDRRSPQGRKYVCKECRRVRTNNVTEDP